MDRAAASIFASNPALVSLMQNKLSTLVGRSSGYIESLPPVVRRRVTGLKGIQKDHAKLEAEFQEEVLQLEKKYFAKFTPLYEKRAAIVNGETEPTEEEIAAGKSEEEDEEAEPEANNEEKTTAEDAKGIPEFWLSAMKNQISLAELITDRDEEALRSSSPIRQSQRRISTEKRVVMVATSSTIMLKATRSTGRQARISLSELKARNRETRVRCLWGKALLDAY